MAEGDRSHQDYSADWLFKSSRSDVEGSRWLKILGGESYEKY